jgi:hypothetical protein
LDNGGVQWFGNSPWAPFCDFGERVPIPVGELCSHCEERIEAGDSGYYQAEGDYAFHEACYLRGMVGSVGHQLGTCSCHGGGDGDPPGMSKREAARAAFQLFSNRAMRSQNN